MNLPVPMQRIDKPYAPWGSMRMEFSVYVYPPRNPNVVTASDTEGKPCDAYYVKDIFNTWNDTNRWKRKIIIGGAGGKSITKDLLKKEPYFRNIYDQINHDYPIPTTNPYES